MVNSMQKRLKAVDRVGGLRLVSLGLSLWLAGALGGCGKKGEEAPQKNPPPLVALTKSFTQEVPVYLDEIGLCQAVETVDVVPQVSGQLIESKFKDGDEVKKGDLLFCIDQAPFKARLAAQEAARDEARSILHLAEVQLKRISLLNDSQVTNPTEHDQAIAAVEAGNAKIASADAAIRLAQIDLDYTRIYSPIDGRVGQRQVDVGNVVKAFDKPLVRIDRMAPIYVRFTTVEQNLARVREAMQDQTLITEVMVPNKPETVHKGKLTFLDNAVQPQSGRLILRADLENTDRTFWPGQFVKVRLILRKIPQAVLVPNQAVQISQQGEFVYVVNPGKNKEGKDANLAELRLVKLGQRQGENVVIESGLNGGESVILVGQSMVTPGGEVGVQQPETQPATQPATQPTTVPATTRSGGAV